MSLRFTLDDAERVDAARERRRLAIAAHVVGRHAEHAGWSLEDRICTIEAAVGLVD